MAKAYSYCRLIALCFLFVLIGYVPFSFRVENHSASKISRANSEISTPSPPSQSSPSELRHGLDYNGTIVMDWSLSSSMFGFPNFRSVESILKVYPNCKLRVIVVGPAVANYYKVGNLPSKHLLLKYRRMGYDVAVEIHHSANQPMVKYRSPLSPKPLGYQYWQGYSNLCCAIHRTSDIRTEKIVPLHLQFYKRMQTIHEAGGGIFSDFSWIHLAAPVSPTVPSVVSTDGFIFRTVCASDILPEDDDASSKTSERPEGCVTSSLMWFRPSSPVPLCVLKRFDDYNGSFVSCLQADDVLGGVDCIRKMIKDCFDSHGIVNYLGNVNGRGSNKSPFDAEYSTSKVVSPSLKDKSDWLESEQKFWQSRTTGYKPSNRIAVWLGPRSWDGKWRLPERGTRLHFILSQIQLPIASDAQFDQLHLREKMEQAWYQRPDNSPAAIERALHRTKSQVKMQHCIRDKLLEQNIITNLQSCPHYSSALGLRVRNHGSTAVLLISTVRQANSSCSPSFVIAGFMKAGTSNLFDMLMQHPQLLRALRGVGFKETGCYLSDQISALRAPQRMNCFPFVEPHQPFQFGDATVYYAGRQDVPLYLKEDNPDLRVIFSVRHPIHRTESQHRFGYEQFKEHKLGKINDLVHIALDKQKGSLWQLRDIAEEASSTLDPEEKNLLITKLIESYHSGIKVWIEDKKKIYLKSANAIYHSLYFPAIAYWKRIFPATVRVISAERMQASRWLSPADRQSLAEIRTGSKRVHCNVTTSLRCSNRLDKMLLEDVLQDLHGFMGLCDWKGMSKLTDPHETVTSVIEEHRLNSSSRDMLKFFYEPFNKLLSDEIGDDFGYNDWI